MRRWLRAVALLAALGTSGCAGLDEIDDGPGRDAPPYSFCDYPREGNLFDAAAGGQILYDFPQGY